MTPIPSPRTWRALVITFIAALTLAGCAARGSGVTGPLVLESQGSFFIGGRNVKSDTLSTLPAYAPSGTVAVEQMYVHYQIPATRNGPAVTMIHGCCLTGKTWESTPDGRMGWDEYFLRKGRATPGRPRRPRGPCAGSIRPSPSGRRGCSPRSCRSGSSRGSW